MTRFRRPREGGFTLPEMLVVIAIIGILAGIAIPTFFGSKRNSQDSQAQASLRSALGAERTYYVDFQQYTTDAAALRKIEPNLDWATTDAQANGVMAVTGGGAPPQVVVLVSTSESRAQFCIMNIAADLTTAVNGQTLAGTYFGRNTAEVPTPPTTVALDQCSGYERTESGWSG